MGSNKFFFRINYIPLPWVPDPELDYRIFFSQFFFSKKIFSSKICFFPPKNHNKFFFSKTFFFFQFFFFSKKFFFPIFVFQFFFLNPNDGMCNRKFWDVSSMRIFFSWIFFEKKKLEKKFFGTKKNLTLSPWPMGWIFFPHYNPEKKIP